MGGYGTGRSCRLSWERFHGDARALAGLLAGLGAWDAILAVTRGGLVPAAIVAQELGIRHIGTVGIASYGDDRKQGALHVLKPVSGEMRAQSPDGAGLLVIDDLADTGSTAELIRTMLPKAHFATVYAKPQGRPLVDTFAREVGQDTWIYFPWDTDGTEARQAAVRPQPSREGE